MDRQEAAMDGIVDVSVDINVPLSTAYNQWTQFEQFPRFMAGLKSVKQVDDTHLRWKAEILGKEVEWEAEITEQIPDSRIAWRSTVGLPNSGVVEFSQAEGAPTRVRLWMEYEPQGFVASLAHLMRVFSSRVESNLKRFKAFIESQQHETGAWRGEVKDPESEHRARPGASTSEGFATHG